jgi:hypothetical protein
LRGAIGLQMQNPASKGGVANPLEWKEVIEMILLVLFLFLLLTRKRRTKLKIEIDL